MKNLLSFIPFLFPIFLISQVDPVFERLSAMDNNHKTWYNIDGYSITHEVFNRPFNEKGLKKVFRKHSLTDQNIKVKDNNIRFNNYYITKKEKIADTLTQKNSYYFVENTHKTISVLWFVKMGTTDKELEEKLVNYIIEDKIPKEIFVSLKIDTLNFGGRKIPLESEKGCYWTFLNTVLCPYNGEMNWSIHKNQESAQEAVENQFLLTQAKKGGKIISEEVIPVEFEGVSTQAKKVTYMLTGLSPLARMSGGRSLIIYYVAEKVRGNYISCVMSYWNNDDIRPEGLPLLLDKVMKIE